MAINRRDFITKGTAFGIGLALTPELLAQARQDYRSLTILHTNDTHSQIDPFPETHKFHAFKGGVVHRAQKIDAVRKEVDHVLLLDAGDVFQGTPYFNRFNGHLEMQVMQAMAYDAMTLGNHDFDIGIQGFQDAYKKNASFPVICSNYDCKNSGFSDIVKPYHVFEKNGIRIGIFGLGIELKGLVSIKNYEGIVYNDPIAVAKDHVRILKGDLKCDIVICLSHLGYKYDEDKVSDRILAQNVEGIDLVIGGHTHTFLKRPDMIIRQSKGQTLINQVGYAGINLGRIDFFLHDKKVKSTQRLIEIGAKMQ
jgi:5'-nucleotidase